MMTVASPFLLISLLHLLACFLSSTPCNAFVVVVSTTQPKFFFQPSCSSFSHSGERAPHAIPRTNTRTVLEASISPGDTVLVVGGTSGVGQLVTKKLAKQGFTVKATCRNVAKGQEILGGDDVEEEDDSRGGQVQVVALDLVNGSEEEQLLQDALRDVAAVVISVGTTAFPTAKWKGGNTPEAIDKIAVTRIANALGTTISPVKKVLLVTSVGVERTGEMPFAILNLFGVLDAKKAGEQAIIQASSISGFDYAIVRPGRLIGGPFTNLDVARLLQIEGGAENGVTVQVGDSLLGDCKRDACAEAIVQCLINDECKNVAFSIVSNQENALSRYQWKQLFRTL